MALYFNERAHDGKRGMNWWTDKIYYIMYPANSPVSSLTALCATVPYLNYYHKRILNSKK